MDADTAYRTDTGAFCLAALARYHGQAADAVQLTHQFADSAVPLDDTGVLRAARFLRLKARRTRAAAHALGDMPLPAIARHVDGHYFLVARIHDGRVLIHDPLKDGPETVSFDVFESLYAGDLFLVTRRALLPGSSERFGIGWFIPAIRQHRKLLGEVLLASFFVQLFALITPLFFQVVIDKVLVHQGLTTLDVLAFGLLVISVFDVLLNGLRTYVFSHTTSRIDVLLGARLFGHLLRLPLAFFQARRVGDTVARVHELDTIREFITGSALTLCIDLLFTVVFFAVLYFYSPTLTWIVLGSLPCYAPG